MKNTTWSEHPHTIRRRFQAALLPALIITLAGCEGTMPQMGGASGMTATGAASGSNAEDANSQLAHCDESLGTLAVVEDQTAPWWHDYYARYPRLGSTVPVLRMMIQQSAPRSPPMRRTPSRMHPCKKSVPWPTNSMCRCTCTCTKPSLKLLMP